MKTTAADADSFFDMGGEKGFQEVAEKNFRQPRQASHVKGFRAG
ncbi:hypothetical protein [Methylovorus sp. MP688]|nr:hypothetical protein [Methylovorus sp. MP688]ADQ85396.1 hypothetical protein MPQ_2250 [Methylovorus sp. MP688]